MFLFVSLDPEVGSTDPSLAGFGGRKIFGVCWVWFGLSPLPVRVTTRIITFLVGNPYKPSFATVTGWGVDPRYGWECFLVGGFGAWLIWRLVSLC